MLLFFLIPLDHFNVLSSFCNNFEEFCICVDQGYWTVISFAFGVLAWFQHRVSAGIIFSSLLVWKACEVFILALQDSAGRPCSPGLLFEGIF